MGIPIPAGNPTAYIKCSSYLSIHPVQYTAFSFLEEQLLDDQDNVSAIGSVCMPGHYVRRGT